jgi:iron(III) transport system permease protein
MRLLGRTSFVTVTGKGDSGLPQPLPRGLPAAIWSMIVPWLVLTAAVYAVIAVGGFVEDIGRFDMRPTFEHLRTGFAVEISPDGLFWQGSAWDSFWITVWVAAAAAPLTTIIGLLTAYILARQEFRGRRVLEFLTMLSFAIPGTVIGVAYIMAFNVPPIEITGTGFILIACFVFRNMPVGVRAGIAALSQIDRSLDEAAATLRARTGRTLMLVVLPLMKPAIIATLVFSFIHAMTAVSAIIFLVTARYNMATAYIVNRVEAGEYSLAISYCAFLIVFMLAVIGIIRLVIGEQKLGRREPVALAAGGH